MNETARLENIAQKSMYAHGIDGHNVQYSGKIFMRHLVQGSVLELGPAEGLMTDILYPMFMKDYTIVDGSSLFVQQIKTRHPDITAFTSLFEEFAPNRKYNNIILGHVLEHVIDPVEILKLCKEWLCTDSPSVVLATVPNASSIHRQVGLAMDLLNKLNEFSDKDRQHGHRRVFFRDEFAECFAKAGLTISKFGGYYLKPLSNRQIEEQWSQDLINAFMALGEDYPEIAADMYVVAH